MSLSKASSSGRTQSRKPAADSVTYSMAESAEWLGVQYRTLVDWIDRAGIVPVPDPHDARRRLLTREQLESLAAAHRVRGRPQRPAEEDVYQENVTLRHENRRLERGLDDLLTRFEGMERQLDWLVRVTEKLLAIAAQPNIESAAAGGTEKRANAQMRSVSPARQRHRDSRIVEEVGEDLSTSLQSRR